MALLSEVIREMQLSNQVSESDATIISASGDTSNVLVTESDDKRVNVVDRNNSFSSLDSVTRDKVATYAPVAEGDPLKPVGDTGNLLTEILSQENRVNLDISVPVNNLTETEALKKYEKKMAKLVNAIDLNTSGIETTVKDYISSAEDVVKVSSDPSIRDYLRTSFNAVSSLLSPTLMRIPGISDAIDTIIKPGINNFVSKFNEFDTMNPLALVNNAISRFIIKKVATNLRRENVFQGYGMPTSRATTTIINYDEYKLLQSTYANKFVNEYNPNLDSELTKDNSIWRVDRSSISSSQLDQLVGYDEFLWDFTIEPAPDSVVPPHPFYTFFPAISVTVDDVDAKSGMSIELPFNRSINLPSQRSLPSSLEVTLYENRYLIVDTWLRNAMNSIYRLEGNGGTYKMATYKQASYLLSYYILNPQMKVIKRYKYYGIPDFDFRYNGNSSSGLKEITINFNIVGSDHY